MRAPFRTGLLALLCALMLGIATIANANIPGRPIDRPEGPPDPDPTMVGDPDAGNGGLVANWRQLLIAIELANPQLRALLPGTVRHFRVSPRQSAPSRVRR